jgi:hypothetical protein
MHVELPVVLYLGLGNVVCEVLFGIIFYILIEYPLYEALNLGTKFRKIDSND